MARLEKLTQNEQGQIYSKNSGPLDKNDLLPVGKLQTLVVRDPVIDLGILLGGPNFDAFLEKPEIHWMATAYLASEFNQNTQQFRLIEGKSETYSVYAVQFYHIYPAIDGVNIWSSKSKK